MQRGGPAAQNALDPVLVYIRPGIKITFFQFVKCICFNLFGGLVNQQGCFFGI